MAIAKCFLILTLCVLQCLARPEHEPNYERRIKRASNLKGQEAKTDSEAARFNFLESDEDLDSSFDPYLGAITSSLDQKLNSEVESQETQLGSTENQEISLRSLIPAKQVHEKLSNPFTSLLEAKSKLDGWAKTENDQVEEAAVNTGLHRVPLNKIVNKSTHRDHFAEIPRSLLDKKHLGALLNKALAFYNNSTKSLLSTITGSQQPQVRSLFGVIKTPVEVLKNMVEGVIDKLARFVLKLLTFICRILHWILPNWIYQAIVPTEIVRLIEEESQMSLADRAYKVNCRQLIQQIPNGTPMELPVQFWHHIKIPNISTDTRRNLNKFEYV